MLGHVVLLLLVGRIVGRVEGECGIYGDARGRRGLHAVDVVDVVDAVVVVDGEVVLEGVWVGEDGEVLGLGGVGR